MVQKYLDSEKILHINAKIPDKTDIRKAVLILKKGGIVAIPTDTVYGIGACAYNKKGIEKIFEIKNRPKSKPLVLILDNIQSVEKFAKDISCDAKQLMKKFWPGPLTLILKAKKNVQKYLVSDLGNIGIRIPNYSIPLKIIEMLGSPLALTSANVSNEPSFIDAKAIAKKFRDVLDLIIDSGTSPIKVESTVVDTTVNPPKILRYGAAKIDIVCLHR